MKMGPISKVMEMVPGMGQIMNMASSKGGDPNAKLRGYMVIMDSMCAEELDNADLWTGKQKHTKENRMRRIARGSGRQPREVEELLATFNEMAKRFKQGFKGIPKGAATSGKMNQASAVCDLLVLAVTNLFLCSAS